MGCLLLYEQRYVIIKLSLSLNKKRVIYRRPPSACPACRSYASRTAAQSKHVQNRSKYVSLPHTPYPAAIHACSCTLTQKRGYSVLPSESSGARASEPPPTGLRYDKASSGEDHTFAARLTAPSPPAAPGGLVPPLVVAIVRAPVGGRGWRGGRGDEGRGGDEDNGDVLLGWCSVAADADAWDGGWSGSAAAGW